MAELVTALRVSVATLASVVRGRAHPRWRTFLRDTWGRPRIVSRGAPVIWLVCPAGGELVQTRGLGRALRNAFPDATLVLSTSNHAFLDVARGIADLDARLYTPWDIPGAAARALDAVAPDVLVAIEAAWNPVLFHQAHRRRTRTMLASGTMVADYHRAEAYRRPLHLHILDELDVVGVKEEAEVEAFAALGVARARLRVLGDLRLDPAFYLVTDAARAALAARAGVSAADRVLVAGSIHPGEETIVLDAARVLTRKLESVRLVLAPRYLSFVPALERACHDRGLVSRRLTEGPGRRPADVVIVDTYGDLPGLYALATWTLLGGTLVKVELGLGQNMVEPLAHGTPIFFGPYARRWTRLSTALREVFPGVAVETVEDLVHGILGLEAAPETVARLRARCAELMRGGGDSAARHVDAIAELLSPSRGARGDRIGAR